MLTQKEAVDLFNSTVQALVVQLGEPVSNIENGPIATRGNYAPYAEVIAKLADGNSMKAKMVAIALVKCGANKQGVLDALGLVQDGAFTGGPLE